MAAPVTWTTYAERLVNTEKVFDKAAFLGLDGKLWGSCNLNLTADEVSQIAKAIADPMSSRGMGIPVEGVKHMNIQVTDDTIQLKKGKGGATVKKAKKCFVIGVWTEASTTGTTNQSADLALDKYIKALINKGF